MTLREGIYAILRIARRELRRLVANPVYFFCMVVAPVGCLFFFTTLMRSGLPTDLPVAVVDLDNTPTPSSRRPYAWSAPLSTRRDTKCSRAASMASS